MPKLAESTTAVLVRGDAWQGAFASEPYEAGWAREAVIFVRLLKLQGDPGGAELGVASRRRSARSRPPRWRISATGCASRAGCRRGPPRRRW